MNGLIIVEATIRTSLENAWDYWNIPKHMVAWAVESDDWEVTDAKNDLRVGGRFTVRTRKRNGGEQVDFVGTYTDIEEDKRIEYDLVDGRHVIVEFEETADGVRVKEAFEPGTESAEEDQRASWLATLEKFKSYVEGL